MAIFFQAGMRRRLSICIFSILGWVSVIILDQPSCIFLDVTLRTLHKAIISHYPSSLMPPIHRNPQEIYQGSPGEGLHVGNPPWSNRQNSPVPKFFRMETASSTQAERWEMI